MKPKWLSVTECAKKHNVSRTAIIYAIRRGALEAERIGNVFAITEESSNSYAPASKEETGRRSAAKRKKNLDKKVVILKPIRFLGRIHDVYT